VTPKEIRELRYRAPHEQCTGMDEVDAYRYNATYTAENLFAIQREIAAQLAEHNQLLREASAQQKAEYADAQRYREAAIRQADAMREAVTPPPGPPPGTIIQGADGRYGICMEGGYVRPIPEEEALRLIEKANEKESKPS